MPVSKDKLPNHEHMENPSPGVRFVTILSGELVIDSEEYVEFMLERNRDEDQDYYAQKQL
jgi:hypothetical protein